MSCYYCSRPEGAPHLPECPKARPFYGKADGGFVAAQANPTPPGALRPPTRDELLAYERSKLPVEKWNTFDWHVAHRDHRGYDKAAETCGGFCDDELLTSAERTHVATCREYGITWTPPRLRRKAS